MDVAENEPQHTCHHNAACTHDHDDKTHHTHSMRGFATSQRPSNHSPSRLPVAQSLMHLASPWPAPAIIFSRPMALRAMSSFGRLPLPDTQRTSTGRLGGRASFAAVAATWSPQRWSPQRPQSECISAAITLAAQCGRPTSMAQCQCLGIGSQQIGGQAQ